MSTRTPQTIAAHITTALIPAITTVREKMRMTAWSCKPSATRRVRSQCLVASGAGCVVACGGFGGDPRAGWRSSCDLHPGWRVDPSVDGVAACPCWAFAVVVWRVLVERESVAPADCVGVGGGECADLAGGVEVGAGVVSWPSCCHALDPVGSVTAGTLA